MFWTPLWFKNKIIQWIHLLMALCKCSIDTIRNKIIVTNYLLIQNIPATWMLITDNNFHYFNTIVIKYAVTLTSEVDLELQLIVINFLSLVTLTSTMYLKNKYLEWKECSIIKALLLCLILHAQKTTKVGSSKNPWKNLFIN